MQRPHVARSETITRSRCSLESASGTKEKRLKRLSIGSRTRSREANRPSRLATAIQRATLAPGLPGCNVMLLHPGKFGLRITADRIRYRLW
ncbi:MAG: hypothetical protein LBQ54_06780 [Planctomycetaceae bacterium]|nr:hypothetical protein [Planctomycetaceae bacterium]